jgi:2-desacetyl-2-hydroxyethyl bacteriochlorophyllide A dehydrogenase
MPNPTVVFPEAGKVVMEDRPLPTPGPGELLVRTRLTLISTGTELTILSGDFPKQSAWAGYGQFPFVVGYHNVGVVEKLGENVGQEWLGRRVFTMGPHAAWITTGTAYAYPIPDGVADDQAVFFTLACVAMQGLRRGRVAWGEAVAIFGLGLVGQLAARFCALAGARPIIGLDLSPERLALLPKSPGMHGISAKDASPEDSVRRLTAGRMADVLFEVTGAPGLIAAEFKVLRPQGRAVILSSPRGPSQFDFHDLCNAPSFEIIGAHMESCPPDPQHPWSWARSAELFFAYLLDGSLDLKPLISQRRPASEAPALYLDLLKDRSRAMGVLLDWA